MKYKTLNLKYNKKKEYYKRVIQLLYWLAEINLTNVQLEILSSAIIVYQQFQDNENLFLSVMRKKIRELSLGRNNKPLNEGSLATALKIMREENIIPEKGLPNHLLALAQDTEDSFYIPLNIEVVND
jgi:hypothetical protein